ncbi:hypothetical protein G9A89_017416 [Geosiphon pyriformis]|nr:hypothetical protein G9A89_017416 [Geosiphon pyriformis]
MATVEISPHHENVLAELLADDEDIVDYEPDDQGSNEEIDGNHKDGLTDTSKPSQVSIETLDGERRRRRSESEDEVENERSRQIKRLKHCEKLKHNDYKKRDSKDADRELLKTRHTSNRKEQTYSTRSTLIASSKKEENVTSFRIKRSDIASDHLRLKGDSSRPRGTEMLSSRNKGSHSEDLKPVSREKGHPSTIVLTKKLILDEREIENGHRDRFPRKGWPIITGPYMHHNALQKDMHPAVFSKESHRNSLKEDAEAKTQSKTDYLKSFKAKNSGPILQDMRQKSSKSTENASSDNSRRTHPDQDRIAHESKEESSQPQRGPEEKAVKNRIPRSADPNYKEASTNRTYPPQDRRSETLDSQSEEFPKEVFKRDEPSRKNETDSNLLSNIGTHRSIKQDTNCREPNETRPNDSLNGKIETDQSNTIKANGKSESRYFIIKSHNYQNVQKSQTDGVWATQPMNASILSEAFKTSERIILIFSVNESRHFQGYCMMTSDVGTVKHTSWTRVNESSLGGNFQVRWLKIGNLPFEKTVHIRNPWNDSKPVKISRDGQELPVSIGAKLCDLFNELPEGVSVVPDIGVDAKNKFDNRGKSRRFDSSGISERYKPYETLTRGVRSERALRGRAQLLPMEIERSRLVRELHPREYSRMMPQTGGFGTPHGQYPPFPPFQGHLTMPPRTWQGPFGSHLPHPGQITHHNRVPNFDRNNRR